MQQPMATLLLLKSSIPIRKNMGKLHFPLHCLIEKFKVLFYHMYYVALGLLDFYLLLWAETETLMSNLEVIFYCYINSFCIQLAPKFLFRTCKNDANFQNENNSYSSEFV